MDVTMRSIRSHSQSYDKLLNWNGAGSIMFWTRAKEAGRSRAVTPRAWCMPDNWASQMTSALVVEVEALLGHPCGSINTINTMRYQRQRREKRATAGKKRGSRVKVDSQVIKKMEVAHVIR